MPCIGLRRLGLAKLHSSSCLIESPRHAEFRPHIPLNSIGINRDRHLTYSTTCIELHTSRSRPSCQLLSLEGRNSSRPRRLNCIRASFVKGCVDHLQRNMRSQQYAEARTLARKWTGSLEASTLKSSLRKAPGMSGNCGTRYTDGLEAVLNPSTLGPAAAVYRSFPPQVRPPSFPAVTPNTARKRCRQNASSILQRCLLHIDWSQPYFGALCDWSKTDRGLASGSPWKLGKRSRTSLQSGLL